MSDFSEDEVEISHQRRTRSSKQKNDTDTEEEEILALNVSDSESEVGNEDTPVDEEVSKIGKHWGKTRTAFFKQTEESDEDVSDLEELSSDDNNEMTRERLRKEEEDDAIESHKMQIKHLKASDYELDYSSSDEENEADQESDDEEASVSGNKELILSQEPEFKKYVDELKSQFSILNEQILPLLNKVREENEEFRTTDGVSFLEAKSEAMLSYCLNICFYLLLKANGKPVKNHPVLKSLVRVKTFLEKIRPLDQKLRPQFDRLLQKKSSSSAAVSIQTPSLNNLMDSESEEEDFVEKEDEKKFKASRMVSVPYMAEENRNEARERRLDRRINRNQLLKEIGADLSDKPLHLNAEMEEVGMDDERSRKKKKRQEEVTRYEEDNLMRLRETKKERKKREKEERGKNQGDFGVETVLGGFDELNFLVGQKKRLQRDEVQEKKEKLEDFMKTMASENKMKKNKKEDEFKILDPVGRSKSKRKRIEEDDMYEQAVSLKEKKQKKAAEKKKAISKSFERVQPETTKLLKEDETRDANYKILANKGLQPHRKKTDKNPRKRLRTKYEKRVKQRKGQVKDMRKKEEGEFYGGEKSGLRTTVVTSRRAGKL